MDIHSISQVYQFKKGTEQTHLYYSWYIPHICIRSTYGFDIHGIYHTYTMYIQVYTTCIHHDIFSFSGFRGSHRPTAPPSYGTSDNVPDPHDEADFDIPDTQSVLETFMSKLSKQTEQQYRSLSALLESLPDPSSSNNVNTTTAAAAKEKGQIQLLPI